MKTMKKLFATLIAVVMALTLSVSAFAAPGDYTITITNSDSISSAGHVYEAYQIFAGDLDSTGTILSNITWGENVTDGAAFITALKAKAAFEVGGVNIFEAATTAADVATVLAKPEHHTSAMVKAFAEVATAQKTGAFVAKSTESNAPYTIGIPSTKTGYYLVVDTLTDPTAPNKDISDFILQVVGDVSVEHKGSIPTVDKQVSETGSTFHDSIASGIGDIHTYRVTAELPDDYYLYSAYELNFYDDMSTGLTLDPTSIVVKAVIRSSGVEVTIDPSCYTVISTSTYELVVLIDNLKAVTSGGATITLSADDAVEVFYKATLNENAVSEVGKGVENEVHIEYSNNPNAVGTGTGNSNEDITHVYPINLKVVKVDGKETSKALSGAKFVLMKDYSDGIDTHKDYAKVEAGVLVSWEHHAVNDGCATDNAEHAAAVAAGKVGTELETAADGSIMVKGLDAGKFYLEEIAAPDGYNSLVEVITITTSITIDENLDKISGMTGTTTQGTVTFEADKGTVTVTVPNFKGDVLPSTGGMGTTLFYAVGGAMVLFAVVTMVTRKRMDEEQ